MPLPSDFSQPSLPPFAHQLIQSGYINLPQMQQVLIETRKSGRPLLEVLKAITNRSLPPTLFNQYKEHQRFNLKVLHGVEFPELNSQLGELAQMRELIDTLIPFEFCRRYRLLPLKILNPDLPTVIVAMVNPSDLEAEDELKRLMRRRELLYQRVGIMPEDYETLIEEYQRQQGEKMEERNWRDRNTAADETWINVTEVFEGIGGGSPAVEVEREEELDQNEYLQETLDAAPIITLVNKILLKALQSKASELHIEPQETCLSVRMRQDGLMRLALDPLPKKIAGAVISRLKVMANLDITQRQISQQARLHKMFSGRKLNFLMHTLPSRYGEKIVLRIFNNTDTEQKLANLITDKPTLAIIKGMVNRSSGLLLVTGPTRGGKSTTLYALLEELNQSGVNIATAEEIIERSLPGITQVEINRDKAMDYPKILQSFLMQDVDVMLIDQIREQKIAEKLLEAASTGHLVLSSLPTQEPARAIANLAQRVEPQGLADNLIGVINQRLLRRICPNCRLVYHPSPTEQAKFRLPISQNPIYKANILNEEAIEQARQKGRLCRQCHGIGYEGQIGVYEIWRMTAKLKAAIAQKAEGETLKQLALQEGMVSGLTYAVNLLIEGETTVAEIERVFADDIEIESNPISVPVSALPPNLAERLHSLEQLLMSLNQQFQELKQELSPLPITPTHNPPLDEILKTPQTGDKQEEEELDSSKETMIGETTLYEELTDPGDWEELRRELDTDKETITADFPLGEDLNPSRREINPFTQVPDPW